MSKVYKVKETSYTLRSSKSVEGTFEELLQLYSKILIDGSKYFDKKKINTTPKTIKSLIRNLNNSYSNMSRIKGLQSKRFDLE